jgi:hypothetical protein
MVKLIVGIIVVKKQQRLLRSYIQLDNMAEEVKIILILIEK